MLHDDDAIFTVEEVANELFQLQYKLKWNSIKLMRSELFFGSFDEMVFFLLFQSYSRSFPTQ